LLVGIFAGAAWRSGGKGNWRMVQSMESYGAPYVRALPRDERRALHRAIRSEHPKSGREARKAVYQDMLAALRADPFDAGAVQAVLENQRDRVASVQAAAQTQWMATVQAMSAQERSAYADRLEEVLKRGPRRKGKPSQP
jgi:uncharacterized membrane protein